MKKLMLIVNPVAGKKQAQRQLYKLIRSFMEQDWQVTSYITGKQGEATEFILRDGAEFDRIVVSGGDGTLNEAVHGLISADLSIPLGYLPAGSTNDFAEFMHISPKLLVAAHTAGGGEPHAVDVGCFDAQYFLNIAAFGIFSDIAYTTPQYLKNAFGLAAYVLDGIKDLSAARPQELSITADGKYYEGSFIFGAICNASAIGGMEVPIRPDDGMLDVFLVRAPSSFLEQQLMLRALQNREYDARYFVYFSASSMELCSPKPLHWALDGEHVITENKWHIQCLPQRLHLIL